LSKETKLEKLESSLPTLLYNLAKGACFNIREAAVERVILGKVEISRSCPPAKDSQDVLEFLFG
jgi:hypothetical protein